MVALVVLGPERLPVAIRTASHWIRLIRSTANSVKSELEQGSSLQAGAAQRSEEGGQLQMNNLSPELQESIEQLKAAAQSVNPLSGGERDPSASGARPQAEPVTPVAVPATPEATGQQPARGRLRPPASPRSGEVKP